MSAPLVSGSVGIARQYLNEYAELLNPSAAMMKALIVNGARSLVPGQYGTGDDQEIPTQARPNNVEGWGQVDLGGTLFPDGGRTNLLWDRCLLETDQTHEYRIAVTGTNELNITVAWSDYPASLSAVQQLVNDLDMKVISPLNEVFYPFGSNGPDHTNNLIGVDISNISGGS